MKTSSFEISFIDDLRSEIDRYHPNLAFIVEPRVFIRESTAFSVPDIVVFNRANGAILVIEVKGGTSSSSVPLALVPMLKSMKNLHFSFDVPSGPVQVALVTTAFLAPSIRSMLDCENIYYFVVDDANDLARNFTKFLSAFERGQV